MKRKIKNPTLPQNEANRQKKRKIGAILVVLFLIVPATLLLLSVVGFTIYTNTQKIDENLLPTASAVPTFYDINGNKISIFEDVFLSPNEVPDALKYAFISTEDKRYEKHNGIDVIRIGGAILHNIKAGKAVEGGSTITQQLVKNTHLTHDRTIERKLKEIALALQLEKRYSKDEILSMYLSVIYFGNGLYGAKQAAEYYFGKDVKDLTVAECATLAAIVKNPSKYSPNKNAEASKSRRNLVIDKMCEQNYISKENAAAEKSRPIITAASEEQSSGALKKQEIKLYFDSVVQEVCDVLNITKYQLSNSGYSIYTCFDPSLQKILLKELSNDNVEAGVNRSFILLDNDGAKVLAYASTLGYTPKRQIGSTIKPILYASALDNNILTLATPIVDEPIAYGDYSPSNFGGIYYGNTIVNEAIKKSMNSVAVKTCDYVGIGEYFDYVKRFGLSADDSDQNYALALGSTANGISPIELLGSYSTFARGGLHSTPSFVRFIAKDGEKIWTNNLPSAQIVKPSTAQLITSALEDTVQDGTAKTLSALPFKVAAKTGTAEREDGQNSDAWCVSFSSGYTLLAWHGSDDGMTEKGGGYPTKDSLEIWQNLSANYNENPTRQTKLLPPEKNDISQFEIDLYSTIRAKKVVAASQNTTLEYRKQLYFSEAENPSQQGSYFDTVASPDFNLTVSGHSVKIEFNAEKIYEYDVYRTDFLGTRKIKHINSVELPLSEFFNTKQTERELIEEMGATDNVFTTKIEITDYPLAIFGYATYTVIAYPKGNETIKNASTKTMFADAT